MTKKDKKLIEIYWQGWRACSFNSKNKENSYKGIEKEAYGLGWTNYIVGDDVKSVDTWSDEKILKIIKEGYG